MEVLARFLERTDREVHVLVRAADQGEADARVRSTIACLFGCEDSHRNRVIAVPGDIQSPGMGLDQRRREALAERVGDVIHSAASVSFTLSLEESREINVTGTERMLDFADLCRQRGGLRNFSYISTAYVAGTHTGDFGEDQLDVGQEFRNPYERSKFEAERLVRRHHDRLPIKIFRPSIVVGEQTSGWTASFNVLYSPLKAFARGSLRALPARRSAPVDVVPVDYVADAVFELTGQPTSEPETFHLVAGEKATTVGRLIDLSAAYLDRRRPVVIPPPVYRRVVFPLIVGRGAERLKSAIERMSVFFPYFSMKVAYRNERARSRLEPAGIRVPEIESYFGHLLDYAIRARWGRDQLARAETFPGQSGTENRAP
jgi:thioester reductase-like protein